MSESYFCEKCGYLGKTSKNHGCEYLAIDVNWHGKIIDQLRAENERLKAERPIHHDDWYSLVNEKLALERELAEAKRVTFDPKILEDMNRFEVENATLKKQFLAAKKIIESKDIRSISDSKKLSNLNEAVSTLDSERDANEKLTAENLVLIMQVKQMREALEKVFANGEKSLAFLSNKMSEAGISSLPADDVMVEAFALHHHVKSLLAQPNNHEAIIKSHDAEVRTAVIEEIKTMMNNTPWLQWGEKLEEMK